MAELPGWVREGDTITRAFGIRYHGGVALVVNLADAERLVADGLLAQESLDRLRTDLGDRTKQRSSEARALSPELRCGRFTLPGARGRGSSPKLGFRDSGFGMRDPGCERLL